MKGGPWKGRDLDPPSSIEDGCVSLNEGRPLEESRSRPPHRPLVDACPSMKGGPWKSRDLDNERQVPDPLDPSMKGGPWKGRDPTRHSSAAARPATLNEGRPLEGPLCDAISSSCVDDVPSMKGGPWKSRYRSPGTQDQVLDSPQ